MLVRHAQPGEQREIAGVVDVDLVAPQAADDEVPAVRREVEVVGVGDPLPPPHFAGHRVEEQDLVAAGIGDQQVLAVGRHHQVVHLPQRGDAAQFLPGHGIHHQDARIPGIEHIDQVGRGRPGQQQKRGAQQKGAATHGVDLTAMQDGDGGLPTAGNCAAAMRDASTE